MLVERGINQRHLAKALKYTPAAIQQAISGGSTTYWIHRAIADYLRVPMAEFWPELYDNMSKVSHEAGVNENINSVN